MCLILVNDMPKVSQRYAQLLPMSWAYRPLQMGISLSWDGHIVDNNWADRFLQTGTSSTSLLHIQAEYPVVFGREKLYRILRKPDFYHYLMLRFAIYK